MLRAVCLVGLALALGACAGGEPTRRTSGPTRRTPVTTPDPALRTPTPRPVSSSDDPRVVSDRGHTLRLVRAIPRLGDDGSVVLDIEAELVSGGPDERLIPYEVLERLVTNDGTEPQRWQEWVDPATNRVGASSVPVVRAQRGLKELVLRATVARVLRRKLVLSDVHELPAETDLGPFSLWARPTENGIELAVHERGDTDAWFQAQGKPRLQGFDTPAVAALLRVEDADGTALTSATAGAAERNARRFQATGPLRLPLTITASLPVDYRLTYHRFVFPPLPLPVE